MAYVISEEKRARSTYEHTYNRETGNVDVTGRIHMRDGSATKWQLEQVSTSVDAWDATDFDDLQALAIADAN